MSTSHFFNNRIIKLPNAYSTVKSVSPTSFSTASYSKVLILNTEPSYAFGGSVNGELTNGTDAIYKFHSVAEARAFFKSGYLWHLSELLFKPSKFDGRSGVSEIQFISALTSIAPTLTFTLSSGTLVLGVKDESANANGVKIDNLSSTAGPATNLKSGYAACIESGVRDASKYIIKFYQGTFKGNWNDGIAFDGISAEDSKPELIFSTPEISSVAEFVSWTKNNSIFENGFKVKTYTDGNFSTSDITSNSFVLATGGSATYSSASLSKVMDLMANGDYSVLIPMVSSSNENADTIYASLQYYVSKETRFAKYLAIGAVDNFATACTKAQSFDSENVWYIYGSPRIASSVSSLGYRIYDSLSMVALVVGRICGLPPQVPATFKDINIDGLQNALTNSQLENALDSGLLTVNYDSDLLSYVITRGINTLQHNDSLQNADGSTFSIQISRICQQLNQDVVINAKRQIFGSNETANKFTVSATYLKNWVKSFLSTKIATEQQDNLIVSVQDVSVERVGDSYNVSYKFETNTEIAFLFFTGISIN